MKKIFSLIIVGFVAVAATSCKKYLDVNSVNPNTPTVVSATPELVLPQALTAFAAQTWSYNFYGSQVCGYLANGGGVAFSGAILSYNYSATDQQALWNTSYDVINDIQFIITATEGKSDYLYYNASAKIMKAFAFQRLVDQYGDLPYSDAFKGAGSITPNYDKATDIYKALGDLLDASTAVFALASNPATNAAFKKSDVLFAGDKVKWAKLANTLKLRLVLRAGAKVTFTKPGVDATVGFLADDAIVNPGYAKITSKQNPQWNAFAYSPANAVAGAGAQYPPTPFVRGFFDGSKLTDNGRGFLYYKLGPTATPTNNLGNTVQAAGRGQVPNSWYISATTATVASATSYIQAGIFKGYDAGQPIMLLSEASFLQAEGILKGIITGDANAAFNAGITASFRYLDKNASGVVTGNAPNTTVARDPVAETATYKLANPTTYLVNYNLATTDAQRLEAIITQKYIAMNFLMGDEAWNEYRRTGYPVSDSSPSAAPVNTIVSIVTESTAPDRLPARLQYPDTEFKYNPAKVPTISPFTSKIFWAR